MMQPPAIVPWLLLLFRTATGAVLGAGMSSLAAASAGPSLGPGEFTLFGLAIPLMSALFGVLGVLLARRVAPISPATERLGRSGNGALTALLVLGVLALVIAGEKRPLVALGWAVGLGYSGLAFVELVARTALLFARTFLSIVARSSSGGLTPDDGAKE